MQQEGDKTISITDENAEKIQEAAVRVFLLDIPVKSSDDKRPAAQGLRDTIDAAQAAQALALKKSYLTEVFRPLLEGYRKYLETHYKSALDKAEQESRVRGGAQRQHLAEGVNDA